MDTPPIDTELIAIRPPTHPTEASKTTAGNADSTACSALPPSFYDSQFDIILRRQRTRAAGQPKFRTVPSRFLNLTNDFEFAGWGSIFRIALSQENLEHGNNTLHDLRTQQVLGQFEASALAANDIFGGVFYTIPSVFAISGVYSPLSMFLATLTLFLWRPIMEELGSALPISGAPYIYLLNGSTKSVALLGAALLLLDFAATVVVSAATAISYLAGEMHIPFPRYVGTMFVFILFTVVSLAGLRESARVASGVLTLHFLTMAVLIVASITAWASAGTTQLRENWVLGQVGLSSPGYILKQVFNGVCIGMLGLTGFECAPAYTAKMRPGTYPNVLRNLHIPAIILSPAMMLFVLALLPLEAQAEENVLGLLAQKAAGRWLRIWVAVDAVIVLCAGVLTGVTSACELLAELSRDCVLPPVLLANLPCTGAPYVAVISFVGFSGTIYASTGADLIAVSKMFSVVWLAVMTLFPLSLALLRFSRPRLPRLSKCSSSSVIGAVVVAAVVFGGNIVIDPTIAGWFALYFLALVALFYITTHKVGILRWVYWAYDQLPLLHRLRFTQNWGKALINAMRTLRRQEVCLLVGTDEISQLFNMVLYVRHNEETSRLKIVHFHQLEGMVPSEMEANVKILDEAFPDITVDLMFVEGTFNPRTVAALAHRLQIPTSLMFMCCPGPEFRHPVAEFGTRIISL
ncbi:hypothetical protein PAXRUDRAFT_768751 [Paxillus rubicundulus Ve08.2h10]|uniref:Uncharacterized protein n=1 Tax=Paxillus rubicundulus Ve08.2h10 TaxID=930991 RepID=A0A0D0DT55_9AGAM|nr:hypothetical protein PAXRUDRAFT_768751 [Paxillus rubicundulus Ve08.2h10]